MSLADLSAMERLLLLILKHPDRFERSELPCALWGHLAAANSDAAPPPSALVARRALYTDSLRCAYIPGGSREAA